MREKNWLSIIKIKQKDLNTKKKIQKKCTRKDIKKGEEITDDYGSFEKDFKENW